MDVESARKHLSAALQCADADFTAEVVVMFSGDGYDLTFRQGERPPLKIQGVPRQVMEDEGHPILETMVDQAQQHFTEAAH